MAWTSFEMTETRLPFRQTWLPVGLILILGLINVFLIKQNLDLRKQLAAGGKTLDLTTNVLKPGDVVAAVTAIDLERGPVIFFDNESLGSYKLTATPTTLLIDEDGKVEHAWVGKWDESGVMEVAAALK